MTNIRITEWKKLPVSLTELCLDTTLRCGQSFRWRKLGENDEWCLALHGRIITLKQDATHLHYRAVWPDPFIQIKNPLADEIEDDTEALIRQYFNLNPDLTKLYEQWSSADANFKRRAPRFTGVRILKQDAWETLVGFICSSNNNIARISQMVHNLCLHYGPFIGHVESVPLHDFPSAEALAVPGVESRLRDLGFGYRAKYLARTAAIVAKEKPSNWLQGLSSDVTTETENSKADIQGGRAGYREAHEQLLQLQGVGPKVADCVCLMGLGWSEAVPIDTHVWQIAQRDYKFGKGKHRSLTKQTYDAVGDYFRNLWGKEAGWAQSVLFAADLKTFAISMTTKTQLNIEEATVKKEESKLLEEKKEITLKRELVEDIVKDEPFGDDKAILHATIIKKSKRRRV